MRKPSERAELEQRQKPTLSRMRLDDCKNVARLVREIAIANKNAIGHATLNEYHSVTEEDLASLASAAHELSQFIAGFRIF